MFGKRDFYDSRIVEMEKSQIYCNIFNVTLMLFLLPLIVRWKAVSHSGSFGRRPRRANKVGAIAVRDPPSTYLEKNGALLY